MALGTIKDAYDIFQKHDFSRSFQLRFLDINAPGKAGQKLKEELVDNNGRYYITTMVVPGRTVQNIDVPYQGFQFKLPGQVSYDTPNPWQIAIRTPGDYIVRNALEQLSFQTANDETGCGVSNLPCKDILIKIGVLDSKCAIMRAYVLHGVYIQNISEIGYNQENTEGTTFNAAFHYQYWRPSTDGLGADAPTPANLDNVFDTYSNKIAAAKGECPTV
jgi:hypothetical protein